MAFLAHALVGALCAALYFAFLREPFGWTGGVLVVTAAAMTAVVVLRIVGALRTRPPNGG